MKPINCKNCGRHVGAFSFVDTIPDEIWCTPCIKGITHFCFIFNLKIPGIWHLQTLTKFIHEANLPYAVSWLMDHDYLSGLWFRIRDELGIKTGELLPSTYEDYKEAGIEDEYI